MFFKIFCEDLKVQYTQDWQFGFQAPATPVMEGIIRFHHDLFFFLISILTFVIFILYRCISKFNKKKNPEPIIVTHAPVLEIIWTVIPAIILFIIAIPSFSLLYSMDFINVPFLTFKVIGHQWYWSYEFLNDFFFEKKNFNNLINKYNNQLEEPKSVFENYKEDMFSILSEEEFLPIVPVLKYISAEGVSNKSYVNYLSNITTELLRGNSLNEYFDMLVTENFSEEGMKAIVDKYQSKPDILTEADKEITSTLPVWYAQYFNGRDEAEYKHDWENFIERAVREREYLNTNQTQAENASQTEEEILQKKFLVTSQDIVNKVFEERENESLLMELEKFFNSLDKKGFILNEKIDENIMNKVQEAAKTEFDLRGKISTAWDSQSEEHRELRKTINAGSENVIFWETFDEVMFYREILNHVAATHLVEKFEATDPEKVSEKLNNVQSQKQAFLKQVKKLNLNVTDPSISYDSYMLPDDSLTSMRDRLLKVDNPLYLPIQQHIRLLITSSDVLHSWAVPSLGIKVDACPGRLNQTTTYIYRPGIYYGQCSEICGVNHGFMPINVNAFNLLPDEYAGHVNLKAAKYIFKILLNRMYG